MRLWPRRSQEERPARSPARQLWDTALSLAAAIALALLIQALVIKPYRVPSGSMIPTLQINERILANRLANRWSDPQRGQIMVFHPPAGVRNSDPEAQCGQAFIPERACPNATRDRDGQTFVKRLVGLPGDRIRIRSGKLILNGVQQSEPYATGCQAELGCNMPQEIRVPPGHYFFLGDNRPDSDDGRFWGPVPRSWIIGRVFASYWPPDQIGGHAVP